MCVCVYIYIYSVCVYIYIVCVYIHIYCVCGCVYLFIHLDVRVYYYLNSGFWDSIDQALNSGRIPFVFL